MEVVVNDLTYVWVAGKWHYICVLQDLSAREIVGFGTSKNKDANLVKKSFYSIKTRLMDIEIFHTDRGSEFKNNAIDEIVKTFKIQRSLSRKGNPYDNAVAEATYNIIKTEFIYGKNFKSSEAIIFAPLSLYSYILYRIFSKIAIHF